jgi:hypothetical protein
MVLLNVAVPLIVGDARVQVPLLANSATVPKTLETVNIFLPR